VHIVLKLFFAVLAVATVNGCGARTGPNETPRSPAGFVTVVGDATSTEVLKQLKSNGIRTSSSLEDQGDSSLIIVVQDSTVGPMPVHLEIAKSLDKRPHAEYLWIFTNTSMVDDQELLELEELECREIFNSQGLPGNDISFAFDSAGARVAAGYQCPKGWDEINRHVRSIVR
jgi:hypothetical protein